MRQGARRIALVHWTLPPVVGGVESHLIDLATAFTRRGAEVALVHGQVGVDESYFPGVVLVRAEGLQRVRAPGTASELSGLLHDLEADVIHAHNILGLAPDGLARALERGARLSEAKLVHTAHSAWLDKPSFAPSPAWLLLAASHYLAGAIDGRSGSHTLPTPLPVDTSRFTPGPRLLGPGRPVRLLHPSRLVPEKGAQHSIRLLGQLACSGIHATLKLACPRLTFDGPAGAKAARTFLLQLQAQAQAAGVRNLVDIVEVQPRAMPALYADSDIVLCPSDFPEPYGLVALEGMSSARAVIAHRVGGLSEIITHGETGLLTDPRDDTGLLEAVQRLVSQPEDAHALAFRARAHVLRAHSIDDFASLMFELYRG